jgi:hypothetical protein
MPISATTFPGFNRAQINALIAAYAAPVAHTHDDRYYTEGEVDAAFAGLSGVYAPAAHNHDASAITTGTLDNARIGWSSPGTIGSGTPNTGAFTSLSAAGDVTIGSAVGMSGRLTIDPGAGQRGIDVQLDSAPGDALRVRNYTGTTIFQIGATGRLLFRPTEDDNEVFKMFDLNGNTIFTMGTLAGSTLLRIKSPSNFNGMFIGAVDSANNTLMNVNYKGQMVVFGRDNGVNNLLNTLNFGRSSSNTPGAGFGAQIALSLESSTTEHTSVGSIDWLWNTATHASRVPDLVFKLIDYGGTREILRLRATGTAGALGFFGVTPVARPAALTQTYSTADRTLGAYTPNDQSAAYTGIDNAQVGSVYAAVADVNALRTAYENLRAFVEDAVQFVNAVTDDLQANGLEA